MIRYLYNLIFIKDKKSFSTTFFRSFFLLSVFSVIPVFCLALLFSNQAEHFWKSEVHQYNQKAFSVYTSNVDNRLFAAQQRAAQLANDYSVLSFIMEPSFTDIERNALIMKSLNDIRTEENGIQHAYLYSHFGKLVLTSQGKGYPARDFYDAEALEIYAQGKYTPLVNRPGFLPEETDENGYITVYQNIPEKSKDSLGCLILNIEKDFLFHNSNQEASDNILTLTVYDQQNELLYSQNPDSIAYQQTESFQKQLQKGFTSFNYTANQSHLVVLRAVSPITGWTYIGTAPMPAYFSSYQQISAIFIILSVVALIASFGLSFIVSYRLYLPLKNLTNVISGKGQQSEVPLSGEYEYIQTAYQTVIDENRTMAQVTATIRPAVKNYFFLSLLIEEPITEQEIQTKLSFLEEDFSSTGYCVILFQLYDYEAYIHAFDENTQSYHNYTLNQIISEVAREYAHAFFRVNRSTWALVLNTKTADDREVARLVQALKPQLTFIPSLLVECGKIYEHPQDLSYSYKKALELLKFRRYREQTQENGQTEPEILPYSPNDKLLETLLQAVKTGSPYVENHFNLLVLNMEENKASLKDVKNTAENLVNLTLELLINLGINTKQYPEFLTFYNKLSDAGDTQKVQELLKNTIFAAASYIRDFNKSHSEKIIENLLEYINTHLSEDISLSDLSENCQLSTSYISRIFKEHLNVGFVEYLNNLRISRSKKLLEETQMTIEQIGFQVGFNNVRSFMRTFKQYTNTTPGQYRNHLKNNETEQ